MLTKEKKSRPKSNFGRLLCEEGNAPHVLELAQRWRDRDKSNSSLH